MGTRGYYIFKYNNKYYIFYNHWDSYFSNLGALIINELKTIDTEIMKIYIDRINEDDITDENGGKDYEGLMKALENPEKYYLENILNEEPELYFDIEYIYIIDLDKNIFKVKYNDENGNVQCNRFNLNSIPENWIELCN